MSLADQLEAAKAEVARLERIAATATCRELGCDMKSIGGCCASCDGERGLCSCSVPVHTCTRCGDSDYGENDEAVQIRTACKLTRDPLFEDEDNDDGDDEAGQRTEADDQHEGGLGEGPLQQIDAAASG